MIKIVPMEEKHIEKTSLLHWQEMTDDLASKLGQAVVRDIFHRGMLLYPQAIARVALDDEKVIGFVFAHIDFKGFSNFQRAHNPYYYPTILKAFLRKPWLLREAGAALKYLSLKDRFTNLGPLLVSREYRAAGEGRSHQGSLATLLTKEIFKEIRNRCPEDVVMTMIRPDNFGSMAAVSSGARMEGFRQVGKDKIFFGQDERIVFQYSV